MKYLIENIIACPLPKLTGLFEDRDNDKLWQTTLVGSYLDEFDAQKSVSYYEVNGRVVEVQIQIIENKLPKSFKTHVQMKGLTQLVKHSFHAVSASQTKWILEGEFKAEGIILKMMLVVLPNIFKKRVVNYTRSFKSFAENI